MDKKAIKKLIDDAAKILIKHICVNQGENTKQCAKDVRSLVEIEVWVRIDENIPLCSAKELCVEILHEVYKHNCVADHIVNYMRSMLLNKNSN